jgi:hypothetical protein
MFDEPPGDPCKNESEAVAEAAMALQAAERAYAALLPGVPSADARRRLDEARLELARRQEALVDCHTIHGRG